MILRGPGPRSLSRPGLLALLGLGALLLPLAPTGARPAGPPEPPKPAPRAEDWHRLDPHFGIKTAVTIDNKQCLACHALPAKEWERLLKQPDTWTKAHAEVIRLMDEVRTTRASLQKAEARLKGALERMDSLMRTGPHGQPAEGGKPAASDQRLKDLEKKLDRLLDEVDALRREVRPKKTGEAPAPPRGGVNFRVTTRAFKIPVNFQREASVEKAVLYSSRDQGKTWEVAAEAKPTDKAFSFMAPADGEYWFKVQIWPRDGRPEPIQLSPHTAELKVYVDTSVSAVGH